MFDRKTVFVIGAGAGVEIDMPVGSALSNTIADKTYIRLADFHQKLLSGDMAVAKALKQIAKARGENLNKWLSDACAIKDGIHHTRSIDAYLNTHKENEAIKIAGKLAIVQSILEAEYFSDLRREHGHWKDNGKVTQSWFPELFYVMQDGVGKSDDIRKIFTNVSFITFNYDRCLEHFLYYTITELYRLNEQQAAEVMSAIEVLRPYGQVGKLDWELDAKRRVAFGAKDYDDIAALSEEIKTFNEQIQDRELLENIHGTINAASRIVFLGFHFHKQNMDLLTVNSETKTVRPIVHATTMDRSPPEQSMIQGRISKMTGEKRPPKTIELLGVGCKALFKHYAATWV